jgi:hypothetical protein
MDGLALLGSPPDEGNYTDTEAIKAALQAHGRINGYSIAIDSNKPTRIVYRCSKSGKYRDRKDENIHESKRRKNTSMVKTNCPFRVDATPTGNDS